MTKGIHDMLNLPMLDEVLENKNVDYASEKTDPYGFDAEPDEDDDGSERYNLLAGLEDKLRNLEGEDHEKAMDEVYSEMLDHARSIMDLAYNTDVKSRRGLMEIAAAMYKNVMDAKNSKRDAQLKLMTLIQSQKRLDFEERKWRASLVDAKGKPLILPGEVTATAEVIEADRNDIIKQFIAKKKAAEELENFEEDAVEVREIEQEDPWKTVDSDED